MKIVHVDNKYLDALAKEVDEVADAARLTLIGNVGRMEEYRWANEEATEWASANFESDTPESVDIWAEAKEWTPIASATDILLTSHQWTQARAFIRRRLIFRERIKKAATKAEADTIFAEFKAQLEYLLQGIN